MRRAREWEGKGWEGRRMEGRNGGQGNGRAGNGGQANGGRGNQRFEYSTTIRDELFLPIPAPHSLPFRGKDTLDYAGPDQAITPDHERGG